MSLSDLDIKDEYRTKLTDVSKAFIVPLLKESISYKRAVGFFSSSSLIEISKGIGALAKNGGLIQIIASPVLSEKDVEAIAEGYESRDQVISEALVRALPSPTTLTCEEKDRFALLADLISRGILDIRIAFIEGNNGIGMYHEKLAIVKDADDNRVAFSGSMNETKTAMRDNYEAIDVFRSWIESDKKRVVAKEAAFDSIWSDFEPGIITCKFPDVKQVIEEKYLTNDPNLNLDSDIDFLNDQKISDIDETNKPFGVPTIPQSDNFSIRPYQDEAIENWAANEYRGLFDMATGTGKTITSIAALTRVYNDMNGDLFVIITCPYQHLVEQWLEDLDMFSIKPIVAYGAPKYRNWKKQLRGALFDRKLGIDSARFICCITTNATFATDGMQNILDSITGNTLIIADEAHNLGAMGYRRLLTDLFKYRLALSATFDRHHDEEGTEALYAYFGRVCITYPLGKAINDGKLSKYRYYPIKCVLTEKEFAEYGKLSRELNSFSCRTKSKNGETSLTKKGELIAQQRARLVAAAENKLYKLKEMIIPYKDKGHILVYCGAAQLLEENEDITPTLSEDKRQITYVANMLGNELGMTVSKFTSEEQINERELLKNEFKEGNLQVLVAIKCLDEGVNIPNIRTAFMLASTTNPKEYIQRRGRLLRISPGKDYAEIFDFITLPYSTEDASGQTLEEMKSVYTLVNNEWERGFEFANYAENLSEALEVLDEIRENYKLDELKMAIQMKEDA